MAKKRNWVVIGVVGAAIGGLILWWKNSCKCMSGGTCTCTNCTC